MKRLLQTRHFALLLLALAYVFSSLDAYAQVTNSAKYLEFNLPSSKREKFVLQKTGEFKQQISKTPNYQKIYTRLKETQQKERTLYSAYFENNDTIEVIDRGLGKSQDLIKRSGEQQTLLLSNSTYAKNNSLRFVGLHMNNNETYLALQLSKTGSKDTAKLTILDLKTNQLVPNLPLIDYSGKSIDLFWLNENTLLYNQIDSNNELSIKKLVIKNDSYEISDYMQGLNIYEVPDPYVVIFTDRTESNSSILDPDTNELFSIPLPKGWEYIKRRKNKLYFISRTLKPDGTEQNEIYANTYATNNFEKVATIDGVIKNVTLVNDSLVYQQRVNFEIVLTHLNLTNSVKTSIDIPNFVSLSMARATKNANEIRVTASSDLGLSQIIVWNLESNTLDINSNQLKEKLLSTPDLELEVQFKKIRSFDGSEFYIRLVYKKGGVPKNAPAFIQAYGGFGTDAYLEPSITTSAIDFIERGGVYVGTSLRGDGGRGLAGHYAAKKNLKFKTYEDLASAAKYLIDTGISSKEKIITWGSSNGGLTVTASALAYPEYFGLVISSAGVLDLLGKETLDARYDNGWVYEYGDSRTSDGKYLSEISPLENIEKMKQGPKFLFITGSMDTRVNPAHTYKMMKAIDDYNSQLPRSIDANLLSINNTGHHLQAIDSDYIAVYYNTAQWTTIYNFLQMNY